jgi:hypothetical protein
MASLFPRAEIVYSYANFGRDMTDYLVSQGVEGIVLAGACDRNTSDETLAGLRDAATKAVVVIRSLRVGSGVTRRNVEIDDDQIGFRSVGGVEPSKSAGAPDAGNDQDIRGERLAALLLPVLVGIYKRRACETRQKRNSANSAKRSGEWKANMLSLTQEDRICVYWPKGELWQTMCLKSRYGIHSSFLPRSTAKHWPEANSMACSIQRFRLCPMYRRASAKKISSALYVIFSYGIPWPDEEEPAVRCWHGSFQGRAHPLCSNVGRFSKGHHPCLRRLTLSKRNITELFRHADGV